ncbi:23S rRNA (pseudouridine(1915)-N(3))-methyltransferase RlmH [Tepidamorphus sp. 3E244]|uniref:23S rRNA (pseudouridine(1915)-N(3))-methyltransferase RlmH n=1 Tax=Tepidamorphus sp. 3E244 TaxID=3385498 RepID=UPI0038FC852D
MHLRIIAVGRLRAGPARTLCDDYFKRLGATGRNIGLDWRGETELDESRLPDGRRRKADEARAISAQLDKSPGRCIVLDERAKAFDSRTFADTLGDWRDSGETCTTFVIGGPDGLDPDFVKGADAALTFGRLTWPHQLVRVMLAEQLYRASTILSGHPYHRD